MKNFKILLIAIAVLFVGCDDAEFDTFTTDTGFVQLATTSGSNTEDGSVVTTVLLGSGDNPNGTTVNFSVTSEDTSRFTVTPSTGSIEIPAGEFTADIVVMGIDNLTVDGDIDVTITLESSSEVPVGTGGQGIEFISTTITIIDNDCPLDTQGLEGTYSAQEIFTAGVNTGLTLSAAFNEAYQIEITADASDPTGTSFILNNSAGFNTYFADGTTITVNSCPRTITFDAGNPTIANFADMALDDGTAATSVNDAEFTFQADAPLGGFGPYQFILTRM